MHKRLIISTLTLFCLSALAIPVLACLVAGTVQGCGGGTGSGWAFCDGLIVPDPYSRSIGYVNGVVAIRHENSPEDAARIVLRHLHERVSIAALADAPRAVPDIWRRQLTDAPGFEIISVAALRSVGVPARLNDRGQAEFWDGEAWERKG